MAMPHIASPLPEAGQAPDGGGRYPAGRTFAFTILDDTDDATVENVKPIYDLLHELGYRTTKTVWPVDCPEGSRLFFAAETLADTAYLEFVRDLERRGFEIAFHGATMESSLRERTQRGLAVLRDELGVEPRLHCNHGQNLENLYWGADRYRTPGLSLALRLYGRMKGKPRYRGDREGTPWFWGDICRDRFDYVRSFAFGTLNTGSLPVHGPYRVRSTRYVKTWFTTSDAPDLRGFNRLVTRSSIEALHAAGGYSILSTHLGKGFVKNGRVDAQVEDSLRYMAELPGWFVPASELLDHLAATRSVPTLSTWRQARLEAAHIVDRIRMRRVRARELAST